MPCPLLIICYSEIWMHPVWSRIGIMKREKQRKNPTQNLNIIFFLQTIVQVNTLRLKHMGVNPIF